MSRLTLAVAASALMILGVSPAAAAPQEVVSLEDHMTCAAIFFAQSKVSTDAEQVDAFEAATGLMLNRAEPLGARQGLSVEQVIERAAAEADQILAQTDAAPADQRDQIIWNWGIGMDRCITAALAE